jgi:hypothetical protein
MKPKDIRYRLTGLTVGTVGAQWERRKTEKDQAALIVNFMENRRVLFGPRNIEDVGDCATSVVEIRHYLTQQLEGLDPRSSFAQTLKAMRAACLKFMDSIPRSRHMHYPEFLMPLGELRAAMGIHLARLASKYELEVDDHLASIFPALDKEEAK